MTLYQGQSRRACPERSRVLCFIKMLKMLKMFK